MGQDSVETVIYIKTSLTARVTGAPARQRWANRRWRWWRCWCPCSSTQVLWLTSSGMGLQTQLAACCILHAVHRQWSYAEHLNLGDLSLQFSVSQVSVQHTYETKQSVSIWSFMIALNYLRLKSIYCKGYLDLWKLLKNKRNFVLLKSINLTFLITNVRVTV